MQWLLDFFNQGGPVLYGILAACLLLWSLILERLWFFYRDLPRSNRQLAEQWQQRSDYTSWTARKIRAAIISRQRQRSQTYLSSIATLIAICPLLGLLGTVTGMVSVFDVLAVTGTGNARAMASGISQATIPTMAGLVVALTGLYFRARFQRLSERGVQQLTDLLVTE
ncbi:biopolymer transporter ExbB [Bacterioplanes sanyensis]|uniref:MotA/TolQ/ExbB proton channel family protein n=1 Tax=Bacterioplanes sanyensis TaxID=1249553 RepID=UPI001677DD7E|nr:MotA/TolQ/ExbB proton channel family protein [Bacterioplanes sanyensis]GGY42008.1 biopolymer transporter ExbB [Bacterioplanes sanyensis]